MMFKNKLACQNMTQGDIGESVYFGMAGTQNP